MGQREKSFSEAILKRYKSFNHPKLKVGEILASQFGDLVKEQFTELGGIQLKPESAHGKWDISTKDFIVELDEERHFNRYRLKTLNSKFYKANSGFDTKTYKQYCIDFEGECISAAGWGKNWENPSTMKQFGKSDLPKAFDKNGSSRWKQRAFYDFLKDVSSEITKVPVFRISIYDGFRGKRLLEYLNDEETDVLMEYLNQRLKK